MFGFVTADIKKLTRQQRERYGAVYCGICRAIRENANQLARLGLQYDMAFLALLHSSLYEPEETGGKVPCLLHPCRRDGWADNEYIRYAADMNAALAWYKAMDDIADEGKSRLIASTLKKPMPAIRQRWPRQTEAMEVCIRELFRLEAENCPNPDLPAACFGRLMGELMVCREDHWAPYLRRMGMGLGRFIYLADAALDYRRDRKKDSYNPFLAMGMEEDWNAWEEYLVLAMASCTEAYEMLPLVQDKAILDNILYTGVWSRFGRKEKTEENANGPL